MIQPIGFPALPPEFDYETEVHKSFDGESSLFFNIFKKRGVEPKRALLIIHGHGEHGGRYLHFPHYLQKYYDLIIAPDLRGHGRSDGLRGHVESFDEFVDDALCAWDVLGKKISNKAERDWFGHSMGGAIVLRTFLHRPEIAANRITLSSPCLEVKVKVPLAKELAARLLARVYGSLQMNTEIRASEISHDPAVVEAYLQDQLVHGKATPKFYVSMTAALQELREVEFKLRNPPRILIQAAGEDTIVDTQATKSFFDRLKHEDKKMIVYPGLFHEIYNETSKEIVFHDWIKWGFE